MQIQSYNADNQFTTWQQVRAADPQSDPTLPVRVGFAIGLYVGELNGQIPGLTDALGQPVSFTEHQFALLDSDITDRIKHRVALTYLTDTLTWLGTVGNHLLLASGDGRDDSNGMMDTFMVAMQPKRRTVNLSIISYSAA